MEPSQIEREAASWDEGADGEPVEAQPAREAHPAPQATPPVHEAQPAPQPQMQEEPAPRVNLLVEKQREARPGIFVRLPSGGKFYRNPPRMTVDREIEVKPMTAMDEMNLKNPDGLLNNESLISVIRACVPAFPVPEEILAPDLDVIMVALSVATYGDFQNFDVTCPEESCGEAAVIRKNMMDMTRSFKSIADDPSVTLGEMEVFIQPYSLRARQMISDIMMNAQRAAHELQRRHEEGADGDAIETVKTQMGEMVAGMTRKMFSSLAEAVVAVETDGRRVDDRRDIAEWIEILAAPDARRLRDAVADLGSVLDMSHTFTCAKCGRESTVEVETNPANFFGDSSPE